MRALPLVLALAVAVPFAALSTVVAGPEAPTVRATVVRDAWGVAHVYADDPYSLFWANGYVQAQDRLAQMEILRHVGEGRLAELTGPSGLELDLVTRRELYTHEERVAALAALDPYWRQAFQAFADGVNAFIAEATLDPTKLPVEYPALGIAPTPWDPTDTVAVAQYLLDVFGRGSGGQELDNAKILHRLGGDWAAFGDLVWVRHPDTYTTIKAEDGAFAPLPAERAHAALPAAQVETVAAAVAALPVDDHRATVRAGVPFAAPADGPAADVLGANLDAFVEAVTRGHLRWGSNAQLLDERFAANGRPLLYGGPQMGYFTPMIPYEIGLHGAGFDAVGMGVAGAPGVIIGRNADMSWTVTSGASDQVDTVAERLVPGDPRRYYVDGEARDMDCRVETHLVRPGPADQVPAARPDWRPRPYEVVEQEVCRTIHGPVLWRTPDGAYAFASNRSYRGDEVDSGVLWLQIGTVRSLADFEALFAEFSFTFNFNFATEDGRIAYYHVGRQPLRDDRLDPRLPRPGWDSSYAWKGFATLPDLPHVVDPASGFTVNWNNNPAEGWASGDARENWGAIHRAELMHETLTAAIAEKGKLTLDDLRAINERAATHEPYADDLVGILRAGLDYVGAWEGMAPEVAAAHAAVDAWEASGFDYADRDGDGHHDHAAFRLYELWAEAFVDEVFRDDLGDHTRVPHWDPATGGDPHAADHGDHGNKFNVLVDAVAGRTARAWCEDRGGAEVDCAHQSGEAAWRALNATPAWDEPLKTRQSRFTPLGAGPAYTIDISNRPSFQHFYDWGVAEGPERSRNVVPPGVSGHMNALDFLELQAYRNGVPGASPPPHLEDQLALYEAYGDKPLLFDRAWVEAFATSVAEIER